MFILSLVFIIPSFSLAFLPNNDGLFQNEKNLREYYEQFKEVKDIVPPDSVIITERSDKIFFPYYKVIVFEDNDTFWQRVDKINEREVYYYTEKDKIDFTYLDIVNINDNFKLIRIK